MVGFSDVSVTAIKVKTKCRYSAVSMFSAPTLDPKHTHTHTLSLSKAHSVQWHIVTYFLKVHHYTAVQYCSLNGKYKHESMK
jgi:hypothetical protein